MQINKVITFLVFLLFFLPLDSFAHQEDTTRTKINYRRTDPNNLPNPEDYAKPKQQVFPLGWNSGTLSKVTSSTGLWTELNPKVPRVDYIGIHFINPDTGWACGANGALIKSMDGGNSWTVINTPTTDPILKVRTYNGQIVIASGFNGLIIRSSDGGDTFTQVTSEVTGDLWGLQMLNDTLGIACGSGNSLTKTTDGGQTWQRIFTPGYTSDYWWIDFLDENYGFIAANGKVLRTTDSGINWEITQAGDNQPLFSIDVIDSLHIAAAGYGGTGYLAKNIYSSDGGYTWINGGSLTHETVNCIQYVNPDTGYLVMTNVSARKTTNRGQDWTTIQGISDNYELQFINQTGYSAGTGLKMRKAEFDFDLWNRLIINDNFSDVFFVNEQNGFAISGILSPIQALYKTTNSGITWTNVPSAPSGNDLLFLDSLTGFIGSNLIYKSTDGGTTWYVPNGGEVGAGKIFFVNETIGWAIKSNVIYKSTDRGESWFTQFTAPNNFMSIFFIDSLNGWATNRNIWQTTDGGNTWIERIDVPVFLPNDVYFPNIDTGWIARRSSINTSLFKSTDTGINWLEITEILGAASFYLFPDELHWIVSGSIVQSFVIYKKYMTYDGGNNWIDFSEDVPVGLSGFSAVTNNLGFAVGNSGLIIRYDDTTYVPVELILFEGKIENKSTVLNWITASELNNYGFYVQKSFDKREWLDLGFIPGKGTTTEKNYYSFIDSETQTGLQYYRLKQQDFNGSSSYSKIVNIKISVNDFTLSQNFPNPANPLTSISFSVPIKTTVQINLYSVLGENVITLLDEEKDSGVYQLILDLSNLPSGVYFYKLSTNKGYYNVKKLILLK